MRAGGRGGPGFEPMQPDWAAGHGWGHVKAERTGQKLGAELGTRGLVQFPRRFVFKCSRRVGGVNRPLDPNSPCPPTPESHVRSPALARTTAVIFQLVLLRGGVWGGAVPREPHWQWRGGVRKDGGSGVGRGQSLAWAICLASTDGPPERAPTLGYDHHPALGSPCHPPLARGGPETF